MNDIKYDKMLILDKEMAPLVRRHSGARLGEPVRDIAASGDARKQFVVSDDELGRLMEKTPAVEVQYIRTDHLHPNDYNPNSMERHEFDELVEEVRHLG